MTSKPCIKCSRVLPLESFYRHPMMADGHLNKCVACCRAAAATHRASKLEVIQAYDRARGNRTKPDRMVAHNAARFVERKPCTVCGTDELVEAHHPDYNKPRDVVFLCRAHHRELHRKVFAA